METTIHIDGKDFDIIDLDEHTIQTLAAKLSDRQKDKKFMQFLKDVPMSAKENIGIIEKKLAEQKTIYKIIQEHTQKEIVWCILFDNFDPVHNSLESYTRIDPKLKSKGLGSRCRKKVIADILWGEEIKKIVSWHSARNIWSFCINRNAGFRLTDFVEMQTFLPTIGRFTDDFKWEIIKKDIGAIPKDLIQQNHHTVMWGIKKHNLIELLERKL